MLLQHVEARAKVDMVGLTIEDQGGDGLDPGGFCFDNAAFLFAEVDEFDAVFGGVEGGGDVVFGGYADRASGVVEYGFVFHGIGFLSGVLFVGVTRRMVPHHGVHVGGWGAAHNRAQNGSRLLGWMGRDSMVPWRATKCISA